MRTNEGSQTRLRLVIASALALLTLVAFVLRAWQAGSSLPWVPHPDEPAIMNVVMRMLRTGDLNPHFFDYPSLWIYLQALVGWVHWKWGLAQGIYTGVEQLPMTTDLATPLPQFFAWGRLATAVAGALTVPVTFAIARRLQPGRFGLAVGMIAAALLVVNAFHISNAHLITTDVASELFVALALLWTLKIYEHGRWRDYLLAGLLTGLAASTKYQMALTSVVIALAHVLHWRKRALHAGTRLLWAALWTIGAFLIASPYIVLAFDEFRGGLLFQLNDYVSGEHGEVSGAWPIGFYLRFFWTRGVGPLGSLLALWGSIRLVQRHDGRVWLLWSFVLLYVLVFLMQGNHWARNIIATQVPLFALAGVGAVDLLARLSRLVPRTVLVPVGAGLLLLLLTPSSVESLRYTQRLQRGDTRVQARAWIEQHVPPGVRVAAEIKSLPEVGEARWSQVHYLPLRPLAWYRAQGYAYVIASSDTWKQWDVPQEYLQWAGLPSVAEFGGPDPRTMIGPRLVIWATGLQATDVPVPVGGVVSFGGTRLLGVTMGEPDAKEPEVGVNAKDSVAPGATLALRTWWQVEQPFDQDFFIFVHILDEAGQRVAQRDTPPWQGRFPTSSWRGGSLVVDRNDLALPPNLAPGTYRVLVGMFNPETGAHPAVSANGQPVEGAGVTVTTIAVE